MTEALAAVSDTPELDARLLREHARSEEEFASFVTRRLANEPVAYIIGTRGFWTIDLDVTRDVLIPRPDSETLIDVAVAHFGGAGPRRVLDLGTGSGALLLAVLDQWPRATGIGVDASEAAVAVARRNSDRIAPGRAEIRYGDWTDGIEETFDLVLCNPPYVESDAALARQVADYEPADALYAGMDGLDAYRCLAPQIGRVMRGIACIEIGWTQRMAVADLFARKGFAVACRQDLGGRDRCLVLHPK